VTDSSSPWVDDAPGSYHDEERMEGSSEDYESWSSGYIGDEDERDDDEVGGRRRGSYGDAYPEEVREEDEKMGKEIDGDLKWVFCFPSLDPTYFFVFFSYCLFKWAAYTSTFHPSTAD
jgi:hypothetical protein